MTADPALAALRQTRAQQQAVLRSLRLAGPLLVGYWCWICWHSQPGPGLSGRGLVISLASAGFVIGALGERATLPSPGSPQRPPGTPQTPVARGVRRVGAQLAFLVVLVASSGVLLWAQPGGAGTIGLIACALLIGRRLPGPLRLLVVLAASVTLAVVAVLGSHGAGPWALAGVVLQLEAARMLAAADVRDPRLPGAIERAHHLGAAGLTEASRAIGMLRDEELPG